MAGTTVLDTPAPTPRLGRGPTVLLTAASILALLGAVIGIGISFFFFDGATMNMLGGAVWGSRLVFSLSYTSELMIGAAALACLLGLVGGVAPAVRVVRSSIADALHES